jgi:hypothetical protein
VKRIWALPAGRRIVPYLMDADGSNVRDLPMGEGTTYENNLVW